MIHKIEVVPETKTEKILFFKEINLEVLQDPRIVPLFGANGVGKSTLLEAIANCLLSREDFFRTIHRYVGDDKTILGGIHPCNSAGAYFDEDINLDKVDMVALKRVNTIRTVTLYIDDVHFVTIEYFNSIDNIKTGGQRIHNKQEIESIQEKIEGISEGQGIIYSSFDVFDSLLNEEWNFTTYDGQKIVYVLLLDEIDSGLSVDNIDILMEKIKEILEKFGDHIQIIMSFNSPVVLDHFPHVISMYDGRVIEMHTINDMREEIDRNKEMFDAARKQKDGRPIEHDCHGGDLDPRRSSQGKGRPEVEGPDRLIRVKNDNN